MMAEIEIKLRAKPEQEDLLYFLNKLAKQL